MAVSLLVRAVLPAMHVVHLKLSLDLFATVAAGAYHEVYSLPYLTLAEPGRVVISRSLG